MSPVHWRNCSSRAGRTRCSSRSTPTSRPAGRIHGLRGPTEPRCRGSTGTAMTCEEMRNHGTDPRTRMKVLQERVEAIKVIWGQHEASYSGEFLNFERIWSYPKPAQRPHPPVLVDGDGPATDCHPDPAVPSNGPWISGRMQAVGSSADDGRRGAPTLRGGSDRPAGTRGRLIPQLSLHLRKQNDVAPTGFEPALPP